MRLGSARFSRAGGFGALACAALLVWLLACVLGAPVHRLCDASTYYMMTSSLLHDRDLVYDANDLARLDAHPFRDAPAALFLVKTSGGYCYGKPFLYPLLAVPFFALLGARGFLVLNFVLFVLAALAAGSFLVRKGSLSGGLAMTALFFGASVFPAYLLWLHPDMMNAALLALAFFLALGTERPSRARVLAAAALFGLAALAKSVNALYALPWIVLLLARRHLREALATGAIVVFFAAGPSFLAALGLQGASPYGGERFVYFDPAAVPYRPGWTPATDAGLLVPQASQTYSPKGFAYSAVKLEGIFAGRVSGLFVHFFPLLLVLFAMRKMDGRKAVLLSALAIFTGVSLFFRSDYFGGPALGNRYFHLYPAMALLADRVRWRLRETALAAVALVLGLPFLVNPLAHSLFPMTHTVSAPYAWFPSEPAAVEDFYYVVREFRWNATAGAVVRGIRGVKPASPEQETAFTSFEPRKTVWGPGVATFGLSRTMPLVAEADSRRRGVQLDRGRHALLLRVANADLPAGAPVPVEFAFQSLAKDGRASIQVDAGGELAEGTIAGDGGEAQARVVVKRALRYAAAHRTPRSVFTAERDRVSLVSVRIVTDAPVVLEAVKAPGREEP